VVLDRDIFSVEPMAIRETVVLGTMMGGAGDTGRPSWRARAGT